MWYDQIDICPVPWYYRLRTVSGVQVCIYAEHKDIYSSYGDWRLDILIYSSAAMSSYKYMYLHGLGSSSRSSKAAALHHYLLAKHNITLHVPDCNIPSFNQLSVNAIISTLKTEIQSTPSHKYRLLGSSLGGLCTALVTNQLSIQHIDSIILLCPAFNILDAITQWCLKSSESGIDEWKSTNSHIFFNYAINSNQSIHYQFYHELQSTPQYPMIDCPVYIVHGTHDNIISISTSHKYIDLLKQYRVEHNMTTDNIQLLEVNDDHSLTTDHTIQRIEQLIDEKWFR